MAQQHTKRDLHRAAPWDLELTESLPAPKDYAGVPYEVGFMNLQLGKQPPKPHPQSLLTE